MDILSKIKARKNKQSLVAQPKDYNKFYNEGWDAFTMLGKSKKYKDLANTGANIEQLVIKVLHDQNINENTARRFLKTNFTGLPLDTYDGLVSVIKETYRGNMRSINPELSGFVQNILKEVKKEKTRTVSYNQKLNVKDFIALTQLKRVKQNPSYKNKLMTKEQINSYGLELAKNAVPYNYKDVNAKRYVYDWASVKYNKYNGILDMPIIDYYTNKQILDEEEKTYEKRNLFLAALKGRRYKIRYAAKGYSEAEDVVAKGKKVIVAQENLSDTETDVLIMYAINKNKLKQKRMFIFDGSYKQAKKFFKSNTAKTDDKKFNARKNFKNNKARFLEYKDTLQEAIALLATINHSRIYMEGSTFEKVEEHLQLQASRQLAKIPNTESAWVLPYISERVLDISKKNYLDAGVLSVEDLKDIYAKTGREVNNANSINELIFSEIDYDFTHAKPTPPADDEEDIEEKETKKTETLKTEKNEAPKTKKEKEEVEEVLDAKFVVKKFLEDNILMQNTFSSTPVVKKTKDYITKLNEENVEMQKVSDTVYNQIEKDILKNKENYKKADGHFYKNGVNLFNKYLKAKSKESGKKYSPDIIFKGMIKNAVEEVQKAKQTSKESQTESEQEL